MQSLIPCDLDRATLQQELGLTAKTVADLKIQLAAALESSAAQAKTLDSVTAAHTRSLQDVTALGKLLDAKVSDHQRQAESSKIAEAELQALRVGLSKATSELTIIQRTAVTESTQLKLQLDALSRQVAESKSRNEALLSQITTVNAQLERAEDSATELSKKQQAHDLELEMIRTQAAEQTLQERERADRELQEMRANMQVYEDATLQAGRDKASALREVATLRSSLEVEQRKVVDQAEAHKALDVTVEQQHTLLADLDRVNGNLRSELSSTQARLRIAEDKAGRTVVSFSTSFTLSLG